MKAAEKTRVVAAFLQMADRHDWKHITFKKLAAASRVGEAKIRAAYPDLTGIIPEIVGYFTMLSAKVVDHDGEGTPHDRLFDALMARFEILQQHRRAVLVLRDRAKNDARVLGRIARAEKTAMQAVLRHAGIGGGDKITCVRLAGVSIVYFAAMQVWMRDEAVDLSKTMAALDKYLRRGAQGERLLRRLFPK